MRTTRGPWLIAVLVGALGLAAAFVLAVAMGPASPSVSWLAIMGISLSMAGALGAGAIRQGRLSRWALLAAAIVLLLPLIGLGAALLLPAEGQGTPLWLGLPPRAAVVLYGVGLLPVLVLPICYALDFRDGDAS